MVNPIRSSAGTGPSDLRFVQQQALGQSAGRGGANWRGSVSSDGSEVVGLMHGPVGAPMQGPVKQYGYATMNQSTMGRYSRNFRPMNKQVPKVSGWKRAYGMAKSGPGKAIIGAGLAVGALGMADSALGRDPYADAGSVVAGVRRFGEAMKPKPSYGNSSFQQSTQGLVFGLHNSRTA